jgi:hypothetical protein
MATERDRIDALIVQLEEFLAGTDRRRLEIPVEVGADRRWSTRDTTRLFARLGRPVPEVPLDQRLTDVLADVVRLRNALAALRDAEEPEAES